MAKTFTAQIDAVFAKYGRRMNAIVGDATQETVRIAQTPVAKGGNMPVDTGNLRGSLTSSLNGQQVGQGAESFVLAVSAMEAGDVAQFGWGGFNAATGRSANYAAYVEFGARGRPGRFFMTNAASAWPATVAASVAKAKARFK